VRRLAWPVALPGGPKHLAVLCVADDALRHPELVAEWARVFSGCDAATLVLHGAGYDAGELGAELGRLFDALGLGADASGLDVLALPAPAGARPSPKLIEAASAVLATAPPTGELAALPWVDAGSVERLRDDPSTTLAA
jgi:hypothetical protein